MHKHRGKLLREKFYGRGAMTRSRLLVKYRPSDFMRRINSKYVLKIDDRQEFSSIDYSRKMMRWTTEHAEARREDHGIEPD